MADIGSSIRPLPYNALDPDALEQRFAANLSGMSPGNTMPFLMGAPIGRMQRGGQLIEANQQSNALAAELLRRQMHNEAMASRRTLAGNLAPHGMPLADPEILAEYGVDPSRAATLGPILTQQGNELITTGQR